MGEQHIGSTERRAGDGEQVADLVDRIQSLKSQEPTTEEGVLSDRLQDVRERLLEFGQALGGTPESVTDLPFTEEAAKDGMPAPLYVRNDREMLNQVTSWLLQNQHIGLVSQYGTGKTAFREIVRRDLRDHDEYMIATLDNPQETTPRKVYASLLRTARETGYDLELRDCWQTRDGIPWATDDARDAATEVLGRIRADGTTLLLIVDEIEVLSVELLTALQVAGDAGARLFLIGTPEGRKRVAQLRDTLDSRLRYYEGIDTFDVEDVAEYIARSLAYFRGESYRGQKPDLFTEAAIRDVHDRTGGVPREVRIECRELFTRAAFIWYRSGQSVDRINVTPNLRHRRFGMSH